MYDDICCIVDIFAGTRFRPVDNVGTSLYMALRHPSPELRLSGIRGDDCCIHLFADDEVIDLYDELKKEEEMEENVSEEMGKEAELIMEEELEEEMEKTLKTLNHRNKTSKCWHRLWYTMIQ